jgi:hypothetical protein
MTNLEKRKTIFLFISIRQHISDLLNTDYIKYLSKSYNTVIFILDQKGIDNPNKQYYKNEHITYIKLPLPKSRFWMLFDFYIRNELIKRFNDNIAVKWRNRRVGNKRRLFLRKIVRFIPDLSPKFIFSLETFFVPGYKQVAKYIKKYKPSLILTATPGIQPFDSYGVLCAKKAEVKTASINTSWDNLTSVPRHIKGVDYMIVWNDWMKKIAKEMHGYKDDEVFVSGTIRFDHYFINSPDEIGKEDFLKSKGLDPNRRTIFFAARNYGGFFNKFIKSFIKWQKENYFGEKLNLFVRVHPLDPIAPYAEFKNTPNVYIERGGKQIQDDSIGGHKVEMSREDLLNTKYTLKYCDVCINIVSTMSLEAMIFGKPVINIGFAEDFSTILNFPHYREVVKNKAVSIANDMNDLRDYISDYLKNPDMNKKGREKILKQLVKPTDGFSYKRSVDFLKTIIDKI